MLILYALFYQLAPYDKEKTIGEAFNNKNFIEKIICFYSEANRENYKYNILEKTLHFNWQNGSIKRGGVFWPHFYKFSDLDSTRVSC